MKQDHRSDIRRINHLATEIESLYHLSSLKLGITDSVSTVLYAMLDGGNECLLSEIYKDSGISKQTINSAIRRLEAEGMLYLEQHTGRAKKVFLTEQGKAYAQKTAARLQQAEMDSFETWTEEEVRIYLRLMAKHERCFRVQIENL